MNNAGNNVVSSDWDLLTFWNYRLIIINCNNNNRLNYNNLTI